MSKKNNDFARVDAMQHGKPFAVLSDEQALSPTYQKLSDRAKTTYMICKLCRQYHRGYDKDYKSKMINGNPLYFYFNRSLQKRYGLGNPNKVRSALIELVAKGFIDVRENNKNRRIKNVYAFTDKWKLLDRGEEIKLSNAAQDFIK